MRISVIVPFLNEERYIEQCIMALLNQDFPKQDYELIFVDNGSRDRSAEIVMSYRGITLLREEQPGPYAARNTGVAVARGAIIAFTDADCVPATDWLTQIWNGMAQTDAVYVLGNRVFPRPTTLALQRYEDYAAAKMDYILRQCPTRYIFASAGNMALRADAIQVLGPFVEWIRGADVEYAQRCLSHFSRDRVMYLPNMTVTHLEINSVKRWLHRLATYGRSTWWIARQTSYRPLTHWQRLRICGDYASTKPSSAWRLVCLFGLLALGLCYFQAGRCWACLEELWIHRHQPRPRTDAKATTLGHCADV